MIIGLLLDMNTQKQGGHFLGASIYLLLFISNNSNILKLNI